MRILFLSQLLPFPLDAGAKIRSYYTLRRLSRQHEVTLLSFHRHDDLDWAVNHVRSICKDVHTVPMRRSRLKDLWVLVRSLPTKEPFVIARDWLPSMARAVRRIVSEEGPFDVVHADQLWMAPYALLARSISPGLRAVLDQHNATYLIPKRMASTAPNPIKRRALTLESEKLAAYEPKVCREFDRVVWVTEEDREAVRSCGLSESAEDFGTVIPISIEPHSYPTTEERPANRRRVTFVGGLHWPPNAEGVAWFIRTVWPLVKKAVPEAVFTVAGRRPPAQLQSQRSSSVEFSGHVADMSAYFKDASVFVVPLMAAGGMRVKILDAWARGVPVVSTTIGAEGLKATNGENVFLADTAESFAEAVINIMNDPALARRLAREGRRTVEENYDWRRTYAAWDEVYSCIFSS